MPDWIETYRGTVPPWECDVTEHFTIAYYFDRLAEAEANLADELGLAAALQAGIAPRRMHVRFARELRAGASFHIDSAPIGVGEALRLGHRFRDSGTGETVTWIEEEWEGAAVAPERREALGRRVVAWDGPSPEPRPEPTSFAGFVPTARGRVKPADLDAQGRCGLAGLVHRFTDACLQIGAAIGMTGDFLDSNRRGYSTFELSLRIVAYPGLDDPVLVETGITHLGNSSLRFLRRMCDPRSGRELARLGQFGVNLDLDARRPAALPEELRARARPLVVPVA